MKKEKLTILWIILLLSGYFPNMPNAAPLLSVSVEGSIVDNYVNITYSLAIDPNTEDFDFYLPRQKGLFLSNATLYNSNVTLWGKVVEAKEAQEIYNETVTQKRIGMLIEFQQSAILLKINNPVNEKLNVKLFMEGSLQRSFGQYSFKFTPSAPEYVSGIELSVDLKVISHLSEIIAVKMDGIQGGIFDIIDGGYHIKVNKFIMGLDSYAKLIYVTNDYDVGTSLISYSNGSVGYFAFFLAPKVEVQSANMSRQIIFTLDVSGSMAGTRISQAKNALLNIIEVLSPNDEFNIVIFNSNVDTMWDEVRPATEDNKQSASEFITSLSAGGSTNIYGAFTESLNLFYPSQGEKLLIFISDGQATAGTSTNSSVIREHVKETNTLNVQISTIAIGSGADQELLENIASDNSGVYVFVENDEDMNDAVVGLFGQLTIPKIKQIVIGISDGIIVSTLNINLTQGVADLQNGSEIIITGMFKANKIRLTADFLIGNSTYHSEEVAFLNETGYQHAELLWALQKVNQLQKIYNEDPDPSIKSEIVEIGIKYGLLIPNFTSMILSEILKEKTDTGVTEVASQIAATKVDGEAVNSVVNNDTQESQATVNLTISVFAMLLFGIVMKKKKKFNV